MGQENIWENHVVKAEFQVGGEHPEKALTAEPDWTLKIPQTPWTWDSSSAASSAFNARGLPGQFALPFFAGPASRNYSLK